MGQLSADQEVSSCSTYLPASFRRDPAPRASSWYPKAAPGGAQAFGNQSTLAKQADIVNRGR